MDELSEPWATIEDELSEREAYVRQLEDYRVLLAAVNPAMCAVLAEEIARHRAYVQELIAGPPMPTGDTGWMA